jgi:exonuclease SbcC
MRIRSLSFRGVGPYRDLQTIDFDQLGESGLYLINGPTGAGKSTIIDCICFALYGRLAGDDADLGRMRSDFAGPGDLTEVDLAFESAAGAFRVIRSPEYLRAKQRGTGETTAKATCRLFRIHPDGREEAIATQVASADAELRRVVGLDRAQFVQTVVLPQGQFAKFLYSDTKDRAAILKSIFGTRVFERVAEILKEDAKAATEAQGAATAAVVAEIGQMSALVGLDDEVRERLTGLAAAGLDDDLQADLDGLVPSAAAAWAAAGQAVEQAQTAVAAADAQRVQARAEADARKAADAAAAALAAAQAAVAVARPTVAASAEVAAHIGITIDESDDAEQWRDRASAAATAAGGLTALVDAEAEVLAWPAEEESARREIADLRSRADQDRERKGLLPDLLAEQQATIADRPSVAELNMVKDRERQLADVARQHAARAVEEARVPELEARVEARLCEAADADAAYQAASRAYRDGIAAELADTLEPEQPCPVCGAIEHPNPARHDGEPVTPDQVEELRQQTARAQGAVGTATAELAATRGRIADLAAAAPLTAEDLAIEQDAVVESLLALTAREGAADAAVQRAASLRAELDEITARLATSDTDISVRESALDARTKVLAEQAAQVARARGSASSVAERLGDIRALESALGTLANHLVGLQAARDRHTAAVAALAEFPRHEGFADVAAAQRGWEEADEERRRLDRLHSEGETRHRHLVAGVAQIGLLCRERADLAAGSADLLELARLFNAGRGTEIGLHIYVLQALFDNVMEAANRRFESLLNGRYRLVPDPGTAGDQRSLQGLGVCVEDRMTQKVRSARSLSGGETFCASLALALGLSDVVRMVAGGIEIGSLFIDEGFGSLDNDQLDEVMVMLGHLSSDGRLVGVISHVDSMKSAITERIDVVPVAEGRPTSLAVTWMR